MVKITDYNVRMSSDGNPFISLTLSGGIEMVQSETTGKFYATNRKVSVPSSFDEETCKALIGTQIQGTIVKVSCDPYEYTIPSTNEIVQLAHTYEYRKEENAVGDNPKPVEVKAEVEYFSANENQVKAS